MCWKDKGIPQPVKCPKCGQFYKPALENCPKCGEPKPKDADK